MPSRKRFLIFTITTPAEPQRIGIFLGYGSQFQLAEYDLGGRLEAFPQGFARGIVRLDSDYAESPAFAQPEFFRGTKP
jgi:hypothetical protein